MSPSKDLASAPPVLMMPLPLVARSLFPCCLQLTPSQGWRKCICCMQLHSCPITQVIAAGSCPFNHFGIAELELHCWDANRRDALRQPQVWAHAASSNMPCRRVHCPTLRHNDLLSMASPCLPLGFIRKQDGHVDWHHLCNTGCQQMVQLHKLNHLVPKLEQVAAVALPNAADLQAERHRQA